MRSASVRAMVMAAGGVCAVSGAAMAAGPVTVEGEFARTRLAGYVYINAATGEVVKTTSSSRLGEVYWQNDDNEGSCNFFYSQDLPTRDPVGSGRVQFGSAVIHWGDLPNNSYTNGYDVAYSTNIGSDTLGTGIIGLNMTNVFFNDYDGDQDPGGTGASGVVGITITDINGGDATLGTSLFQGWIYTVDLEGTTLDFNLSGQDVDGDTLHDFGYSYSFEQGQAEDKGIIGPQTVRAASLGGLGTATGCPDGWDWFNGSDFSDYVGGFWFGGGDCSVPRPYGSFLLNLYGVTDGTGGCVNIDYNGDGVIDFGDYLEFLNFFDGQDPAADLTADGVVDFGDYLEFLNRFDRCSTL